MGFGPVPTVCDVGCAHVTASEASAGLGPTLGPDENKSHTNAFSQLKWAAVCPLLTTAETVLLPGLWSPAGRAPSTPPRDIRSL